MNILTLFATALAVSHHVERCRNTLQPALDSCHGDRDCRCGVLARAGQLCLKSSPSGSLLDLVRSVDGDCMKTHFMEINAFDNLLTTDKELEDFVFGNFTSHNLDSKVDGPQRAEDLQDQRLAQKFVEWVDHHLELSKEAVSTAISRNQSAEIDSSPIVSIGFPSILMQIHGWARQLLR